MASFKNLCQQKPELSFDEYWNSDSKTELYHFIGKDIVYFHALFWPAILTSSGFRTPTQICVHGFLTVNGQKMSKSRGTFIKARTYLDHLNPEYLRYYYASKLNNGIEDIDFQMDDFVARINSDLVGKLVNIASRTAGFITKLFNGKLASDCQERELYQEFVMVGQTIEALYETREYARAVREIMKLADLANRYIDQQKPWALAKSPENHPIVQNVCSVALNLFRVLVTYLKPILPELAANVETFFNIELTWDGCRKPLVSHTIQPFQPSLKRIETTEVINMSEASKEGLDTTDAPAIKTTALDGDPIRETISLEEFAKIDLRVAKIIHAEQVEEAHKLLKLVLDLGGEIRHVFSGIKEAYDPQDLIGKHVVIVANLAPRKMRFGVSEGMVLTAGAGGKDLWILEPHTNADLGSRIR